MESLVEILSQETVFAFLLLYARIVTFVVFMPIFGHTSVSVSIRGAISFYLTLFLFPLVNLESINYLKDNTFIIALISEITLGFIAALLVNIIFSAIQIVGDLIGFATALSMANLFDPATGTQQGIMSRFLYIVILVVYFQTGMYEVTLLMLSESIGMINLGQFSIFNFNLIKITIDEINKMFIFAFSFALPLFFIGFILDIYYGYGTKSMPAFSPFVVTFQIKFTLIFVFLMLGFDIFISSFVNYFIGKFS